MKYISQFLPAVCVQMHAYQPYSTRVKLPQNYFITDIHIYFELQVTLDIIIVICSLPTCVYVIISFFLCSMFSATLKSFLVVFLGISNATTFPNNIPTVLSPSKYSSSFILPFVIGFQEIIIETTRLQYFYCIIILFFIHD